MSHILEREKADRASKAWRLSMLGWTIREIGDRLGISKSQASTDVSENSHLGKIGQTLGPHWNDKGIAEVANRKELLSVQASHVQDRRDLLTTVEDMQPADGFDSAVFDAYIGLAVAVIDRARRDSRGEGLTVFLTVEEREAVQREAAAFLASGAGLLGEYIQAVVAERSAPIAPLAKRSGWRVA